MSITNGYCTLDELKTRLLDTAKYTAATISFTAATKTIVDSAKGLRHFQVGETIQVAGSVSNNGFYTVVTGNQPGSIVVSEALADEVVGATITIRAVTDQKDDAELEKIIEAVSRWIDSATGRRFYAVNETRYYRPDLDWLLEVDDLLVVTSIKTNPNGLPWAVSDYVLCPYNAIENGEPFTHIETTPDGSYKFPRGGRVQVVGTFGYAASAPSTIREVCLLVSMRVARRKDLIFGITGGADLGTLQAITALGRDGEVQAFLNSIPRRVVA